MKLLKKQRGFIGGGITQHTHSSGSSGGDILQHLPAGAYVDFCGTVLPPGFLACDGAAVSRTTYARLFTAIGTTWGVGDGATTFNVPDLRRRSTVNEGGTGTAALGNAVGNVGGQEKMSTHTHPETFVTNGGAGGARGSIAPASNDGPDITGSSGSGALADNVYHPCAVVQKIIKT